MIIFSIQTFPSKKVNTFQYCESPRIAKNIKGEEQSWRNNTTRRQDLLESYINQDGVVSAK